MKFIAISKELIPYRFDITINRVVYGFDVNYNKEFDYFTVDLYGNGYRVLTGEKIVYGRPLFRTARVYLPKMPVIVPFDVAGRHDRVTHANFNDEVFLYLPEGEQP